ncbi:hypothetical protein [Stigmatella aurantiaca]|uniref:Lipoprotein MlpA n=1 Tax=Stigmatella aurantiaca (strain DW4/3-1) TaxID=378806 RepID=E3FMA2_STIAD|nr:hypothetical protein [Stigmatella aurantiaca]ADO69301.1 Putative lipoprotein MlpA [Stigmatella aurantiaca DW4/3-1]
MNRRILGLLTLTALATACDSDQPPIGCPVQSLEWAATYKPKGTSACPVKAGEQIGILKFSTPSGDERLSLKPATLTALDALDPERLPYSLGALAKESDAEGFCSATNVAVAEKHTPASDGVAAQDIIYRWDNVRVLALPQAPGTQLVADLEYTENGCTAQYEVWAMWPGDVECRGVTGGPDDSLCQNARSINPDFAVTCDPTQMRCVPAKRPPSLE